MRAGKQEEMRDRVISFKSFFSTRAGRKILFELMNRYHILNQHDGGQFQEGQRSVVLYILQQTKVDLKKLDELLKGELE